MSSTLSLRDGQQWTDLDKAIFQLAPADLRVFESIEVHRGMLSDRRAVSAYEDALKRVVTADAVVVDLGAGLGILSFFAARSGAKLVYAIERNRTIRLAERVAASMGVADRIAFARALSSEVELPRKANVIVSQTLGHLGYEEDIVRSMIDARERFLAHTGVLVPQKIELFVVPADSKQMEHAVGFWKSGPYGLDLGTITEYAVNNIYIVDMGEEELLARPKPICSVDLRTATSPSVHGEIEMRVTRAGIVRGLAGWFHAQLVDGIAIDTAPGAPRTHWRQCFLPIHVPFSVEAGDILDIRVEMTSVAGGEPLWYWSIKTPSRAGTSADVGRIQSTAIARY